jgi:ATP-dependent exoDNAse (exonuclease V) alpha subunit
MSPLSADSIPPSEDTVSVPVPAWPGHVEVNPDFQRAYDLVDTGAPFVFITGRAGTGKSTLIHCLRAMTTRRYAVVAPTGVAALNAGGQTIHSFFRFRPGPIDLESIKRLEYRRLYENLEMLLIDEISMVRADMLDAIERFLRLNGPDPSRPFGGIQIVAVGDLYQLPPVVSSEEEMRMFSEHYETEYFFSAHCLRREPMDMVELRTVYRQNEAEFVDLLNRIREGDHIQQAVDELNAACLRPGNDQGAITLAATNAIADQINGMKMAMLPGKARTYHGLISGSFGAQRILPAPMELVLKLNAQVMFTRNDADHRWVNGTLGRVVNLDSEKVEVEVTTEFGSDIFTVEPTIWESTRYRYDEKAGKIHSDVLGAFHQYPLVPAWAVTIHKSQGKTLENIIIDLGAGAFAHGQVYVALSRCRTLANIRLKKPLKPSDVQFDPRVKEFHARHGARALF